MNEGLSLAGGAIALSFLDVLVQKGVLTAADARKVLDGAQTALGPSANTPAGAAAMNLIAHITRHRFPGRK
jgi:hypothetical protein